MKHPGNFLNFFGIPLKYPWNNIERPLNLPWNTYHWNFLETSVKLIWNLLETCLKLAWIILETYLKHPWKTFETILENPWNTLEILLKLPWLFLETSLKYPWNFLKTSLKHPRNFLETPLKITWNNALQTPKTLKEKKGTNKRTNWVTTLLLELLIAAKKKIVHLKDLPLGWCGKSLKISYFKNLKPFYITNNRTEWQRHILSCFSQLISQHLF